MADFQHDALTAAADHERQAAVDKIAAELVARLEVEAETNGIEAASRTADAAILAAVRWMATREGGHARIADWTMHIHAEAVAAVALQDAPSPGRSLN